MSTPRRVSASPSPRHLIATAVGLALSAAMAAPARAQENTPKQLPKISVEADELSPYKVDEASSSKYTAPLRDTAQTVTVIPSAVFEAQNATTLRDVLRNTPGITFQAGEGGGGLPGDQNFTLRGFNARNAIFVDGLRDVGSYTRDAFFLEQVEVLKGPAATVAGRSATGGAIDQITKKPRLDEFVDMSAGLGTDDYGRVTADVNQAIRDSAAVRVNLLYHDAGIANRDVVENSRWGVAPSLALGLGTPTRLTLSYLHLDQDNVPDYGLPWNLTPGDGAGIGLDFSNFYGLRDYDYEDIETDLASMFLEHDFSESLAVENALRYFDGLRDSAITAPRPPNRQLQRRTMGNEMWANQTNLLASFATGGARHTVTTGVELAREKTANRNSAQTTNQPQIGDVQNPDPNGLPLGPMPANDGNPGPSQATVDSLGLYVFDTVELTERWQLTGGLRWDDFDVEFRQTTLATGITADVQTAGDELSWQAGILYKPRGNGSIYAGYGTSFDPSFDAGNVGVALVTVPTAANNPGLAPEETRNYELGTKWDLADGQLGLTAAVFRVEKTNARTRTASDQPFILSGEQRVDGIEVSASGNITPSWSLFGGYVYMETAIDASLSQPELDNELVLTPESSFNLWTAYALPWGLGIGAGAQYVDNVFRDATNVNEVPSYWLVDAMASYSVSKRFTLRLNAANIADEDYVDRVGGGHFIPGPGRTVSLTADVSF